MFFTLKKYSSNGTLILSGGWVHCHHLHRAERPDCHPDRGEVPHGTAAKHLKRAHGPQQDLLSLRMRSRKINKSLRMSCRKISEVCSWAAAAKLINLRMRRKKISDECAAAGFLKSAYAQQQDLWSLRMWAAGSLKSAHAQQQDLWSLRMRSSRLSEVCACAAAWYLKPAQQCLEVYACAAAKIFSCCASALADAKGLRMRIEIHNSSSHTCSNIISCSN
jgi:hypothetical protein